MRTIHYVFILCLIIVFVIKCQKESPIKPEIKNTWIQRNDGLTNLQIRDICINPSKSEEIYVATARGIFRSNNGGKNWLPKNKNLTSLDITDIEMTPGGLEILIASWGAAIFISENKGENWNAFSNGLSDPRVFALGIADDKYFAGTESGLFEYIKSEGKWQKNNIPGGGGPTTCIAIATDNLISLYIGIKYKGVYKSVDGGLTWESKNNGLHGDQQSGYLSPTAIEIDPLNYNRIFLGSSWLGVYISTDAAENWNHKESWPDGIELKCLAINPNNTDELYVGTNQGVLHSIDAGNSWQAMNDGLTNLDVRAIAIDPKDSNIIYAGTMGGGMFKMILE